MEHTRTGSRAAVWSLAFSILLLMFVRLLFAEWISYNWGFIQLRSIPTGYQVAFLGCLAVAGYVLIRHTSALAALISNVPRTLAVAGAILGLSIAFQYDSIVYGSGNILLARIGEQNSIVLRWFDEGAVLLVALFDHIIGWFVADSRTAAWLALKVFSFAGSALTLSAAMLLAQVLTADRPRRVLYFLILTFGPQSLVGFGFIGLEPWIVAILYWFALFAVGVDTRFTTNRFLALWVITLIGVFTHVVLWALVPATVYLTVLTSRQVRMRLAIAGAAAAMVGLAGYALVAASGSLEYARYVLLPDGPNMRDTYNLFSLQHLADLAQLIATSFPAALMMVVLLVRYRAPLLRQPYVMAAFIMTSCFALAALFIDPIQGMAMEAPRLAALLAPASVLLVLCLHFLVERQIVGRRTVAVTALLSMATIGSILPVYLRIDSAAEYAEQVFDSDPYYYQDGCVAFRDAYFLRGEYPKADNWEWRLPTHSEEYVELRAVNELAAAERYSEAISLLYSYKTRFPLRVDPRLNLAGLLVKTRQFDRARMELDTALMLAPYNWRVIQADYSFYRDVGNFAGALERVEAGLEQYPHHIEFRTDAMIYRFRLGERDHADSLAADLLAEDSTLAFAHLIRGFVAESRYDTSTAISRYRDFLRLAPQEPEAPQIRKRLNTLELARTAEPPLP